jgi:hypothetical protein
MGSEFLQGLGADIQRAFAGAEVATPGFHQFQFEALLSNGPAAQQVAEKLQAIGFSCRSGELEGDEGWLCLASQPLELDVPALDRLGEDLVRIIEQEHAGQFNGWSLLASAEELTDPAARVLQVGQFDARKLDSTRFPHVVVAHVLDAIEPMDRGPKYDDKIAPLLATAQAGHLVAAGSQLNGNGEVVALRFEAHLADTDTALQVFTAALLECGAPRGSFVRTDSATVPLHRSGRPN